MNQETVENAVEAQVEWTETVLKHLTDLAMTRGVDIIQACIIMAIGFGICRWIRRVVHRVLERSSVEASAVNFVTEIIYFFCLLVVALTALGTMGVSTTTLSAALGGIGLGIGLALKDKVSNVASGIFILIFKQFRVGDFISVAGQSGTVKNIRIMYTELVTMGNQLVVIPNMSITSSVVTNYSMLDTRYIEFNFCVGYATNLVRCVALIHDTLAASPYVKNKDNIQIYIKELGDSAITIYARPEVDRAAYYQAMNDLYVEVKAALDAAGIDIPYPQLVVHKGN